MTNKSPLISIDEYFKEKDGTYTLYADFRTMEDYRLFQAKFELEQSMPAFIIKGYKSKYRIFKQKYYELNIELINRQAIIPASDGFLFGYEIQLNEVDIPKDDNLLLVSQNSMEGTIVPPIILDNIPYPNSFIKTRFDSNYSVVVYNVGQGNWNEVDIDDYAALVYDTGTTITASRTEIVSINNRIIPQYINQHEKPMLVISHWDKDHYNCILGMNRQQIKSFAGCIFPCELPNTTSIKAYDILHKELGSNNMYPVGMPKKQRNQTATPNLRNHIGRFSFYTGMSCSDRNLGGIQVFVSGQKGNLTLTGDCGWFQLMHILSNESNRLIEDRVCNIVVPHHGSGHDETYAAFLTLPNMTPGKAAISVCKNKNRYHHPSQKVMSYLQNHLNYCVKRTDEEGDIVINL